MTACGHFLCVLTMYTGYYNYDYNELKHCLYFSSSKHTIHHNCIIYKVKVVSSAVMGCKYECS